MKAARRYLARPRGFTLIEILVTLAITGVIFQGLSQLTGGMLLGWSRSASALESQSASFTAIERMSQELEALLPLGTINGGAPVAAFAGSENYMEFARHSVGYETIRDVDRVSYQIESSPTGTAIVRRSNRLSSTSPFLVVNEARSVLAEFKGKLVFAYSGNGVDFSSAWINQAAPPRYIRISLLFDRNPNRVFAKLISPMNDATSECLLPSYRLNCERQLAAGE